MAVIMRDRAMNSARTSGLHREVGVALPVPLLGVGEAGVADDLPVHHLLLAERQRAQRLGEQRHRLHAHGDLAGPRAQERAARRR